MQILVIKGDRYNDVYATVSHNLIIFLPSLDSKPSHYYQLCHLAVIPRVCLASLLVLKYLLIVKAIAYCNIPASTLKQLRRKRKNS